MAKKLQDQKYHQHTSLKAIILVIVCTIMTSTGQILWKVATKDLGGIYSIITNAPLIVGFICYAISALLLVLALREGALSVLYPFVALSFIWVTIASIFLFHEHVNIINWLGVIAIIIGVSLIGYGSTK